MPIELQPKTSKRLIAAFKLFFLEQRSEEIGELQATLLLDFCLKEVGPAIYNKGVKDAQAHISRTVDDLDSVVFEIESR